MGYCQLDDPLCIKETQPKRGEIESANETHRAENCHRPKLCRGGYTKQKSWALKALFASPTTPRRTLRAPAVNSWRSAFLPSTTTHTNKNARRAFCLGEYNNGVGTPAGCMDVRTLQRGETIQSKTFPTVVDVSPQAHFSDKNPSYIYFFQVFTLGLRRIQSSFPSRATLC